MTRRAALVLAFVVRTTVVRGEDFPLVWRAPEEGCPTQSELRAWLAAELTGIEVPSSSRAVVRAVHDEEGWRAEVRTLHRGVVDPVTVRGATCEAVARHAVQEVFFALSVLPPPPRTNAQPAPPPVAAPALGEIVAPRPATPVAPRLVRMPRASRLVIDVGGGGGLALLVNSHSFAEEFAPLPGGGGATACGALACPRNVGPFFGRSGALWLNVRYNLTRRLGLAVGLRWQPDAAPWTVSHPDDPRITRGNPLADMLFHARLYGAFSTRGFARRGAVFSGYVGLGLGQIEPRLVASALDGRESAHIVTGYGNAHAGLRGEYGLTSWLHVGGEFTVQVMFPSVLVVLDVAAFTGVHFG